MSDRSLWFSESKLYCGSGSFFLIFSLLKCVKVYVSLKSYLCFVVNVKTIVRSFEGVFSFFGVPGTIELTEKFTMGRGLYNVSLMLRLVYLVIFRLRVDFRFISAR